MTKTEALPRYPTYADWVGHSVEIMEAHPSRFLEYIEPKKKKRKRKKAGKGKGKRAGAPRRPHDRRESWEIHLWLWAYGLDDYDGPTDRAQKFIPVEEQPKENIERHALMRRSRVWLRLKPEAQHWIGPYPSRDFDETGLPKMRLGSILRLNSSQSPHAYVNAAKRNTDFTAEPQDLTPTEYRPFMTPQTQTLRAFKKGLTIITYLELTPKAGNPLMVLTKEKGDSFTATVMTHSAATAQMDMMHESAVWENLVGGPTKARPQPKPVPEPIPEPVEEDLQPLDPISDIPASSPEDSKVGGADVPLL